MGERNKYQARKSITKVSCRISSLRKVAEEVRGSCETSKTVVLVYRSAGRWCSRAFAPGLWLTTVLYRIVPVRNYGKSRGHYHTRLVPKSSIFIVLKNNWRNEYVFHPNFLSTMKADNADSRCIAMSGQLFSTQLSIDTSGMPQKPYFARSCGKQRVAAFCQRSSSI